MGFQRWFCPIAFLLQMLGEKELNREGTIPILCRKAVGGWLPLGFGVGLRKVEKKVEGEGFH